MANRGRSRRKAILRAASQAEQFWDKLNDQNYEMTQADVSKGMGHVSILAYEIRFLIERLDEIAAIAGVRE